MTQSMTQATCLFLATSIPQKRECFRGFVGADAIMMILSGLEGSGVPALAQTATSFVIRSVSAGGGLDGLKSALTRSAVTPRFVGFSQAAAQNTNRVRDAAWM
mgnify:CR=1 FL=1